MQTPATQQKSLIRTCVLTVSDRCSAGAREDRSGPAVAAVLPSDVFDVTIKVIPDGVASVRDAIREALVAGYQFIPTTGGTGVTPRDQTPEGTLQAIDLEMPGISHMLREEGRKLVPTAVMSRGVAGVISPTAAHQGAFVVNFPGSTGGATDGATLVHALVPHILDQIAGGDH